MDYAYAVRVEVGDTIYFKGEACRVEAIGQSKMKRPTFTIRHKGTRKTISYVNAAR